MSLFRWKKKKKNNNQNRLRKKEQDANVAKKKAAEDEKKEAKKRKREKAQKAGEDGSEDDYEVVCEGDGEVAEELENAELEGGEQEIKRPRVAFDIDNTQVTEIDTPQFVEEPEEDPIAPKKRKPVTRQMRQKIKQWKKNENQRDERD